MTDEIVGFETPIPSTGMNAKKVDVQIIRTSNGIEARFNGLATIELYNLNGVLIDKTVSSDSYSRDLMNGIYVLRINGESVKFVK